MNISNINNLKKEAIEKAQKEVDIIFEEYSKLIVEEISNQLPKGHSLISGNGMCWLHDEEGKEISSGCAWNIHESHNSEMSDLCYLQYRTAIEELHGRITVPQIITSNK